MTASSKTRRKFRLKQNKKQVFLKIPYIMQENLIVWIISFQLKNGRKVPGIFFRIKRHPVPFFWELPDALEFQNKQRF